MPLFILFFKSNKIFKIVIIFINCLIEWWDYYSTWNNGTYKENKEIIVIKYFNYKSYNDKSKK